MLIQNYQGIPWIHLIPIEMRNVYLWVFPDTMDTDQYTKSLEHFWYAIVCSLFRSALSHDEDGCFTVVARLRPRFGSRNGTSNQWNIKRNDGIYLWDFEENFFYSLFFISGQCKFKCLTKPECQMVSFRLNSTTNLYDCQLSNKDKTTFYPDPDWVTICKRNCKINLSQ